MAIELIVFDLGSTLFEYENMPLSWVDYYESAFKFVNKRLNCNASFEQIDRAVAVMKMFNPRINPREIDFEPEFIFEKAFEGWGIDDLNMAIELFFDSFNLKTRIYDDSISSLKALKKSGCTIAALTDVPSGMPDEYFKKYIPQLLLHFDDYISSCSSGYRKPNPYGIDFLRAKYGLANDEILFIGDEDKDLETAKQANCYFIRMDRKGSKPNSISDLSQIVELIQKEREC